MNRRGTSLPECQKVRVSDQKREHHSNYLKIQCLFIFAIFSLTDSYREVEKAQEELILLNHIWSTKYILFSLINKDKDINKENDGDAHYVMHLHVLK